MLRWVRGDRRGAGGVPGTGLPDGSWSKVQIIVWLRGSGVDVGRKAERTLSKAELLAMVAAVRSEEA